MKEVDFLVVGAGIAGLLLSEMLERKGQQFLLVDHPMDGEASRVSSGVINPVTGMRFVLSWEFQKLEAHFVAFYKSLEQGLQHRYIKEMPLYQLIEGPSEENAWHERMADPYYAPYLGGIEFPEPDGFSTQRGEAFGKIAKAYLVEVNLMMDDLLKKFYNMGSATANHFNYNELTRTKDTLVWRDVQIRKAIIFTEGFRLLQNPFFNWLPLVPLKGDCLRFHSDQIKLGSMIKKEYAIIPSGPETIWCGASFVLNDQSLECDLIEQQKLMHFLEKNHIAFQSKLQSMFGIRPASRDRRPYIGPHPLDSRLVVFNGLGTKGLSLAPYCAEVLTEWLIQGKKLPDSLSLERLIKKGICPPEFGLD